MAALSLGCCQQTYSSFGEWRPLFVALCWPLLLQLMNSRGLAPWLWCMGLVAPWHVVTSRTRNWTCVPCIGRRILNYWTTREVLDSPLFVNPRSDMKVFQDSVEGLKASLDGDFPGGPVARTLHSQYRGSKFFSWGQGIRSHMPQLKIPNATTWRPSKCVLSCFSRVQLCVTLWTVACKAPLSMGFSRQEYRSGSPCPSPEDLPDPGL